MDNPCPTRRVGVALGNALVNGGLEAAHVFYRHVTVCVAGFQVFVENRKDLRVEHLESSNPIYHSLQVLQSEKNKK